jgi:putative ABC transport system permease protein
MGATSHLTISGLRHRGAVQVLALVGVCALCATAVVAGLAAQTSAADQVDAAYERAGRPDLVLYGDPAGLEAARSDDAVAESSPPRAYVSELTTPVGNEAVDIRVTATDPEALPPVATPDLVEGHWPEPGDEDAVVVEHSLVAEGVTAVGATLAVDGPSGTTELVVVGSAVDLLDCFWPTCDPLRLFARPETVEALAPDGQPSGHLAAYALRDPDTAAAVGGRLTADAAAGIDGANHWTDTRGDILVVGTVFASLVGGFGVVLLVAAAFVIAGATAARLVARRRSLGLLAATGFTPRQLLLAVWAEHLVLGGIGVLLGWLVGTPLSPLFQAGLDGVLEGSGPAFEPRSLVIAFLLVGGLLSVSVLVPAGRAVRQPPNVVLRDVPTTPDGGRRLAALARRLGAGPAGASGLRRAFARPGRTALAAGALVVAAAGAVVSIGFIGTLDAVAADPSVTGNPWDVSVEATTASATEVAEVLDTTPAVGAWFTERDRNGTVEDATYTVRVMGGDPDAAAYVVQEGAPLRAPDEAIVGYGFLDETGLAVGDPVHVEVDDVTLDLTIVGWYSDTADAGKIIQVREEALPASGLDDDPDWRVVAATGVSDADLAATLNDRFGATASAEALSVDGLTPEKGAMVAMAVLLGAVALANLLATTLSATRERARAIGILRTVGASTGQLLAQAAVGAGAIGLLAAIVGIPLGWVGFTAMSDGLTTGVGIGPGFASDPSTVAVALVLPAVVLLAAGTGALASLGLARRPASDLVRYE